MSAPAIAERAVYNKTRLFLVTIEDADAAPEYPQFTDGLRQLVILEMELASNRAHSWVEVGLGEAPA